MCVCLDTDNILLDIPIHWFILALFDLEDLKEKFI